MARFKVELRETLYYEATVEAEDEDEVYAMMDRGEVFLDRDGEDEEVRVTQMME